MIRMEKVTRSYGEHRVLEAFSLKIEKGEAVALVGKSGCGKTTLLRILAGLDRAYQGQVFIGGEPAEGKEPWERRLAMVFQEPALWNHMTVEENILFPLGRKDRKGAGARVEHICEELGIGDLMKRFPAGRPKGFPWQGPWPPERRSCCWTSLLAMWTERQGRK